MKLTKELLEQHIREELLNEVGNLECITDSILELVQGLNPEELDSVFQDVYATMTAAPKEPIGFREHQMAKRILAQQEGIDEGGS